MEWPVIYFEIPWEAIFCITDDLKASGTNAEGSESGRLGHEEGPIHGSDFLECLYLAKCDEICD
ncbi:hypothetical protein HI914_05397 [Erysiphe necator]|nr:hypothetical protein HI914_05397 [Erysiphe necator]